MTETASRAGHPAPSTSTAHERAEPSFPAFPSQDVLAAFSTAFTVHLRIRRVQRALRALRLPLARLEGRGPDGDPRRPRLRRLRSALQRAGLLCAALVDYLHQRSLGEEWQTLVARLMLSSRGVAERVAAAALAGVPPAPLSRLDSLGPAGGPLIVWPGVGVGAAEGSASKALTIRVSEWKEGGGRDGAHLFPTPRDRQAGQPEHWRG